MKRFSRSDSSRIVPASSARLASVRSAAKSRSVPADPTMAASGVRRSCEIEVSRAWRRRSASAARSAV
jgi:hypothetical protein